MQEQWAASLSSPALAFICPSYSRDCASTVRLYSHQPSQHARSPSQHARSNSHLIRTGSEALARSGSDDSCTLALLPDRICLAKTWHVQPELNPVWAGFAQYDPGHLWKNATESESGKLAVSQLRSARTWPEDSCTLAGSCTRCIYPKPDWSIQIGSGLVLHRRIRAFFGRTEPNRMQEVGSSVYSPAQFWLHTGCNGHN